MLASELSSETMRARLAEFMAGLVSCRECRRDTSYCGLGRTSAGQRVVKGERYPGDGPCGGGGHA